jgi:iron complex outermembrane receptor protein
MRRRVRFRSKVVAASLAGKLTLGFPIRRTAQIVSGTVITKNRMVRCDQPRAATKAMRAQSGVKMRTRGVDVVANHRARTSTAGTFDMTIAANFNKLKVLKVPTTTSTLDPAPPLVIRSTILTLEQGTPRTKIAGTLDWERGPLGATLRGTYYGDVNQPGTTAAADLHTGNKLIADIEGRYTFA